VVDLSVLIRPRNTTSAMPSTPQAARCSSSRIFASRSRVMSAGVDLFEPASPRVRQTVTISLPARAHLASVPATVNSWSSGCAWIDSTRFGAGGSLRGMAASLPGARRRFTRSPGQGGMCLIRH